MPDYSDYENQGKCPVSGLKIIKHPEWTMSDPSGPYQVKFRLIGDQILFTDTAGFVTSKIAEKSLTLNESVRNKVAQKAGTYVQIENFSKLDGYTIKARLYFIKHFQKRKAVCGMVFLGVPHLTALSIKIAARIYLAGFPVKVAYSYEEAIKYALEMIEANNDTGVALPQISRDRKYLSPASAKTDMKASKTIDECKTDLLRYLGMLNLDVATPDYEPLTFSEDHPFAEVFDTIDLINNDLNQIAIERQKEEQQKIELERKLVDSKKLEALGTLAGGIAHDFNNILSGMIGYCQLAKLNIENSEKAGPQIDQIKKGALRAAELVNQILILSRNTEYKKQAQVISPVVQEAMNLIKSSIPSTIQIDLDIVSKNMVMADTSKIHQIVMNLCTNAYQAMADTGGILSLSLSDIVILEPQGMGIQISPGNYVCLEVRDTGYGMDAQTLDRIFDPYFTTKEVGKGTGMGLSLVHAIVQEHEGFVKADSTVGTGSVFTVYLPTTNAAGQANETKADAGEAPMGSERILVVDDELSILESNRELLVDYGYHVSCYTNGQNALAAFKADPYHFDLILTDMTMPGMTGETMAREMIRLRKDLPIILCTGFNEKMSEQKALDMGIRKYIEKPLINQPIAQIVRNVLDGKD